VKYRIERDCRIEYAAPVREHHVQIRLTPWECESQALSLVELQVAPEAAAVARYDCFGNLSHHFAVVGAHQSVAIRFIAEVETRLSKPADSVPVEPERERLWLAHSLREAPRLWDFVLHQGALTAALPGEIAGSPVPEWAQGVPLLRQVQDAFGWVQGVAEFDPEAKDSVCALPALFDAGRGTAADLSHLLIALLRRWGVPARFVSGYRDAASFDPDDAVAAATQPRPQTLHNWVEVLIPGAGWRGFDVARGLPADASYIRVAVGRDATDVRPLRQTSKGSGDPPQIDEALNLARLDQ
jgi:transglutaminase-like putative cysteine protease